MNLINKIDEVIGPMFEGIDELGKFYVVTRPTHHSTLNDIMFEADIPRMYLQFRGGLLLEEILGLYKSKAKAKKAAKDLIKRLKEQK